MELGIAVLVRIFSNPGSNVLQKQLVLRGQPPLVVNATSYLLLAVGALGWVIWERPGLPGAGYFGYAVLSGITGALGNGFLVRALQRGDLSVLGPINAYKSVIGLATAYLLIGERPRWSGALGIGLIIAGSYLVLGRRGESGSAFWAHVRQPAVRDRLIALVLTGVQSVFDKQVIEHAGLGMAFVSWSCFGALFSMALVRVGGPVRERVGRIDEGTVARYAMLMVTTGLMVASTNYVFRGMAVGEALALFQLSILVSVLFGVHFFREEGVVRKLLGALVMMVGSMTILLGR